jgi:hypothetical protein
MADAKLAFGTATAFTITLNSLASSSTAGRESTAIDNSSNLYLDAFVEVLLSYPNLAPANDKAAYVYAYGSVDGTNYTGSATGSDAAITLQSPTVVPFLGVIPTPTQNIAYRSAPMSVATAFGGILPPKWGIIVVNFSGQTLNASLNSAQYRGVYNTVL